MKTKIVTVYCKKTVEIVECAIQYEFAYALKSVKQQKAYSRHRMKNRTEKSVLLFMRCFLFQHKFKVAHQEILMARGLIFQYFFSNPI